MEANNDMTLFVGRKKLNKIKAYFVFKDGDDLIKQEDEKDLSLDDISAKGNKIYLKVCAPAFIPTTPLKNAERIRLQGQKDIFLYPNISNPL